MEALLKSLIYIQQNLNAPKNQYNKFGNFSYRSLEDIEAAIKPLLNEQACGIRFQDEVVEHCGRTFLKTTLIFFNDKGESVSTTAEAEHSVTKSGMDSAQITGSASSYARKYAMNAMFCIDDCKDMDSNEVHNQGNNQQTPTKRSYTKRSDKYEILSKALAETNDMGKLLSLFYQNQEAVNGDPNLKNLFTARKQQIQAQAV